jgi:AcrR family transcriptional regulator
MATTARAEITRDRILDAACDLIASDGIDDVRIARVAQRAGASTALVHHYFSTREELLEQALLHSFELAGDERFGEDPAKVGAPTERMAYVIRSCLPAPGVQEREWVLWVELWLRAVREPAFQPVAARLYQRYRAWIEDVVSAGVAAGEFTASDPGAVADHAMALLDGVGVRALLRDPMMDLERARRMVAEILGRELGVDPGILGG